jgi:hypothetical protein
MELNPLNTRDIALHNVFRRTIEDNGKEITLHEGVTIFSGGDGGD